MLTIMKLTRVVLGVHGSGLSSPTKVTCGNQPDRGVVFGGGGESSATWCVPTASWKVWKHYGYHNSAVSEASWTKQLNIILYNPPMTIAISKQTYSTCLPRLHHVDVYTAGSIVLKHAN